MQLGDIFDKMNAYDRIVKDFKFNAAGLGARAWSHRYANPLGEVLEIRSSDWVVYAADGSIVAEGFAPVELKRFFLGRLTSEELLEHAVKS